MHAKGLLLGVSMGILAAAVLIAGVSLVGTGANHIDILSPGGQTATQQVPGASSQVVGPSSSLGQQVSQVTSPGQPQATTTNSGESIFELLSPFVLAAALGAAFYGLYTRRVNAE